MRFSSKSLKTFATRLGADLVGVAGLEKFKEAPEDGRPDMFLAGARAVVVLGVKIPRGVGEVWGDYTRAGKTIAPYLWYGYGHLNWELSHIAARLTRSLESKGYRALPFPPTGFFYRNPKRGDFSHRHAAVAAGLGEMGWSALLLTPQFGSYQRIVSIITDAPMEPDPPYSGPPLCDKVKCGSLCSKLCPTRALRGEVSCVIGGRTYRYYETDYYRCRWALKGLYKGSGSRTHVEIPANPTHEDLHNATKLQDPLDAQMSYHTNVNFCGRCLIFCPAGRIKTK